VFLLTLTRACQEIVQKLHNQKAIVRATTISPRAHLVVLCICRFIAAYFYMSAIQ
jgi:hypothetical protein